MVEGYRIVGTDSSPEMLDQCRELARDKGLTPDLHRQFMQQLSLDEQFGFIFIDDCTFTLVVEDQDVHELFNRVWNHLKPNGTFLFDFYATRPDAKPTNNVVQQSWVKAPDGSIFVSKKISSYDPDTRITDTLQIHDRYVNGEFVGSQAYEDPNREHDTAAIVDILSAIGFVQIQVGGYHTDEASSDGSNMVSIRCKKQG
jgi:SAM-dependent methyltransferase